MKTVTKATFDRLCKKYREVFVLGELFLRGKYHRIDGPAYIDHRTKLGQTVYCYQNRSFIDMDPQDFLTLAGDKDVMEMYINLNPSDEDDDGLVADYWRCDAEQRHKLIEFFKNQGKQP